MDISREVRMAAQRVAIQEVRAYAASGSWRIEQESPTPQASEALAELVVA